MPTAVSDRVTMLFLRHLSMWLVSSFMDPDHSLTGRARLSYNPLGRGHGTQGKRDQLLAIISSLDHSKCGRSSGQGPQSLPIIENGSMENQCFLLTVVILSVLFCFFLDYCFVFLASDSWITKESWVWIWEVLWNMVQLHCACYLHISFVIAMRNWHHILGSIWRCGFD